MKKVTKILSVLMAAVMLMTALCVPVSAASIEDTAKKITSGKEYSVSLSKGNCADYKIVVSKNGTLKINYSAKIWCTYVFLYDSNGNNVDYYDYSKTIGDLHPSNNYSTYSDAMVAGWNETMEKSSGTITYQVKKGTYYIRFRSLKGSSGKLNFTATFPSSTSSSSSSAKISYLSITVPKGTSMQLNAVLTAKSGTSVSWSSSKSSVVSVTSKGKITAKAKGTAVITAKLGSSTTKLRVKVV